MRFLRPAYASGRERRVDFWVGFGAWLIADAAAIALQLAGVVTADRTGAVVVANVVFLVVLAFTRRFAALGGMMALACALLAVVVAAPFGAIACFAFMAAGPGAGVTLLILGFGVGMIPSALLLRGIHRSIGDPASSVKPSRPPSAAKPAGGAGRDPLPPGSPPQWARTGRTWWDGERWIEIAPGERPPPARPRR